MSNQTLAAPDPGQAPEALNRGEKRARGRGRGKTVARAAAAGGLALLIGLSGTVAAQANGGGGGTGGGPGGSAGNFQLFSMFSDGFNAANQPFQGYGMNSTQWFYNNSGQPPQTYPGNAQGKMNQACSAALANAESRRPAGSPAGMSRVVGMVWASDGQTMWGNGSVDRDALKKLYDQWAGSGRPYVLSGLSNQAAYNSWMDGGFNEGYNAIGAWPNPASAICIALNSAEPALTYKLNVTTDHSATFELAGSKTAVSDTINASANGGPAENVNADVTLRWAGVEGNPKHVTKRSAIKNQGSTRSQNFTPADFGWDSWPSGKFWFDVSVPKQGMMEGAVSHAGENDSRENWSAKTTPPEKTLTSGTPSDALKDDEVLASGMFYNAEISAATNGYASQMTIIDTIKTDKVFIGAKDKDVASAAYVLDPDGKKVAGATIKIDRSKQGEVKVSGTIKGIADKFQSREYKLVVPTYVLPTKADYTIADDSDVCYTAAEDRCIDGNDKQTRKVTPTPDKVWVLDEEGALTAADPKHTNQQGADEKVFLMNDEVAAVVNGAIKKKLAENLSNYQLVDDWTKAAKYVDFSDAKKAKVFYETAPGSGKYTDVTSQFDIKVNGTVTTATAKDAFLKNTKGLAGDRKTKLVISGAFKDDYDTNGETVVLHNNGSEVYNNETVPTNEPPVYTWTPDPNKQVLGSNEESGDNAYANIDGMSVWPGQKVEYSVGVDLRIPGDTARGVKSLAVQDVYDPNFEPDKDSIQFVDSRDPKNPKAVPAKNYKVVFDEAKHMFTATFTDEWIAANIGKDGANSEWLTQGWLTMRFTGTVKKDTPGGTTVQNQAFQIINGASTATEIPIVEIPTVEPDKEDLNTDLVDIDGKTVVQGDHILYRLTMDASVPKEELAYNVHKLGMVDDFDEEYLDLNAEGIKVTEKDTGDDVTAKFNIQVKDGVAYIFAKTIDTENPYGGEVIPGDPQPEDLAEYDKRVIQPKKDAIIDQGLLGKKYWITLDTVVKKETDGYTIKNQATQNIQNTYHATKIVSNPLKDIDPDKDVVVSEETKDNSINESEVKLNSDFNYRLNSSEIPANRAYKASQWSLSDTFDKVHDQYTGIWAIYANTDVYDGDELIFKKGALLEDSAGHQSVPATDLFAVTFDEESYTIKVEATQKYLDLVNTRMDLANSFSVYTKMIRIAPGDKIENQVKETYNNVDRDSNIVWTKTPENPEISVIKYTLDEGQKDGDRNKDTDAYPMTKEQLAAVEGTEEAEEVPGETPLEPEVEGTVPETKDAAPAEGEQGEAAEQSDPEAKPEEETKEPEAPALPKQNGVKVGISFTNTGDVPLTNIQLVDTTHDGLKGTVEDITCLAPAPKGETGKDTHVILGGTDVKPDENGMVRVTPEQITDLAVGQTVDCEGTLQSMEPGALHGDTVVVTGESVFTKKPVKAEDPWFAKAPSTPGIDVIKYTLEEGTEKGDRNKFADALALTPEQAKDGVKVAFDVTNIGDEALKDLDFADVTVDGTTGKVDNVQWAVKLAKDEKAGDGVPTITIDGALYKLIALDKLKEHTLAAGETVTLVGTLKDVEPGTGHTDNATVTGTAVNSGTKVTDEDPWNAKYPTPEVPDPKGAVTGDPMQAVSDNPWLFGAIAALLAAAVAAGAMLFRRRGQAEAVAEAPEDTDA